MTQKTKEVNETVASNMIEVPVYSVYINNGTGVTKRIDCLSCEARNRQVAECVRAGLNVTISTRTISVIK